MANPEIDVTPRQGSAGLRESRAAVGVLMRHA